MEPVQISSDLKVGHATHEGMSGKHNEDYYGIFGWQMNGRQTLYLGVVADGVGGQTAGEVASHLAVDTVKQYFGKLQSVEDVSRHLEQAILAANRAVYNASQENPELRGMSTTMAMVAMVGDHMYTAHVGDSRIYLLRDGRLQQISTDHTWAQEAIEAGLLTREQAKTHPNRNVIRRHLGGQLDVEVDHRLQLKPGLTPESAIANQGTNVQPGDTFLICSDGLTDMISDEAVFDSLRNHYFDLKTAANELVDKANKAGGKDNITVVLLQIPGGTAPAPQVSVKEPVTARQAAAVAAAAAPAIAEARAASAAAAPVAKATPQVAAPRKRSVGLFMIGGLVFGLIAVVAVVALVVLGGSLGDDNPTPVPTTVPAIAPVTDEPSATSGAPATVPVLSTDEVAPEPTETETPSSTSPALIPTLKSTNTPTNTPVPPTRTPTPTSTSTPVPPPSGGNGGDNGEEPPPPPPPPPP